MKAELVIIGTELLLGEIVDTNAFFLAQKLAECGLNLHYKSTVGDNWQRIIEVLSKALSRADLVIISGGLGPTADDLTRETVAATLNRPLELHTEALAEIEHFFMQRYEQDGVSMPHNNRKQAYLPQGAEIIPNQRGTAPGFILEANGKVVITLPGVPIEMEGMVQEYVLPYLQRQFASDVLVTRNLNFTGIGESNLEELVSDILDTQTNPTIALYASQGRVRIRLTAKAASVSRGEELIRSVEMQIAERTQEHLYGYDDETLEEVVCRNLIDKGATLALAESCTGGLVGNRITDVPGSSECFMRGYVVYSNQAKQELLGVKASTLRDYGAVSKETALEMANGARNKSQTDYSIAITGIAGPGGGTASKPVGLVYISLAGLGETRCQKYQFKGTRQQIKQRAAQAALTMLWHAIH